MDLIAFGLVLGTALPLLRSNAWWIRVLDFPRIQIAVLLGLTLAAYAALRMRGRLRTLEYALAAAAGLALAWQAHAIAPYTRLHPVEMAQSHGQDDSNRISLLVFNVLSTNRDADALLALIAEHDPDIILLSEPTRWWQDHLDSLKADYPYTLFQPQDNQYGKLLYSRLELQEAEVRFLVEPGIPSLRTKVRLRSGTVVSLYGVHPRPPGLKGPDEDRGARTAPSGQDERKREDNLEREDSDMRDAELLLVAKEVRQLGDVPVIVAGDFNDVAWSHTTALFQRIGGLLDPRVGRGMFNSFDARSRLLRYPLDHVFASQDFLLVELRRLPDIGSDHFPVLVVLDHHPRASVLNEEPQPDVGDKKEAEAAIEEGASDR